MFCRVSGKHACHARVESAPENGCDAGFFETVLVGPLPAVLVFCFVVRFIVGGVHIADAAFQTCVHDGKVLVGQCQIDNEIGTVLFEQCHQLRHIVGIYFVGCDIAFPDGFCQRVAFAFCARSDYDFVENVRVLSAFVSRYGSNASGSDD